MLGKCMHARDTKRILSMCVFVFVCVLKVFKTAKARMLICNMKLQLACDQHSS